VHHLHGNFELGFEITYALITPALHIVERAMPRLSNNVCKAGEAWPKGAEVKPFLHTLVISPQQQHSVV
jgi:hypothetical protein